MVKLMASSIIETMEKWVSKVLIDSWDNTGFQIGNPLKEISRILIALDLDKEVLAKAINEDYQMIITHHPIIFKPITSLTTMDHNSSIIYDTIKNDIVVYNAHTNLDLAEGGVNDCLAEALGLKNAQPLSIIDKENLPKKFAYGRIGYVERIGFYEYLDIIKTNLQTSHLIVYGNPKKHIERVAICGGSGSDFIIDAYNHEADLYITGDIKYHEAQYAHGLGLTLIDAGHFNTEKVVLPIIKEYLERELGDDLEIEVLKESNLPQLIY